MSLTLKLTHFQDSVHVQVPNLRPDTIYARFLQEFPDCIDPSPKLCWRDSDGDWIHIRQDDNDLEAVLAQVIEKTGSVHIQSGDVAGIYEPTDLGTLMKRYERVMDTFDLLTRSVVKLPHISNILIVTKPDPKLARLTKELTVWLLETFPGVAVYVDKKLEEQSSFKYRHTIQHHASWKDRIHFWETDRCEDAAQKIHLAVALGGDGTVLYVASMFQQRVPPIVAFHLGSLGFLTNFHFDNYRATMTNIIRGDGMNLNLRMRLQCSVYKYNDIATKGPVTPDISRSSSSIGSSNSENTTASVPHINGETSVNVSQITSRLSRRIRSKATSEGEEASRSSDEEAEAEEMIEIAEAEEMIEIAEAEEMVEIAEFNRKAEILQKVKVMDSKRGAEVADLGICHENAHALVTRIPRPKIEEFSTPSDTWQVLNEVTLDRGSNAGMLLLELFVDGEPVTTILADGLVIATATGSTAYSLSLGGSLIHPDKNAIIISPIAPHSLTARPMIIPGTRQLRVCVPETSRTTAWASFDGRHRQELGRGDSVKITGSKYPAATICRRDQSTDWFLGLTQVLNWNSRVLQKPFGSHL